MTRSQLLVLLSVVAAFATARAGCDTGKTCKIASMAMPPTTCPVNGPPGVAYYCCTVTGMNQTSQCKTVNGVSMAWCDGETVGTVLAYTDTNCDKVFTPIKSASTGPRATLFVSFVAAVFAAMMISFM
jgi:hypothetical protein